MCGDFLLISAVYRVFPTLGFFLGFLSLWTGFAPPYMLSSAIGAFDNQVNALLPLPFHASNHLTLVLVCPVLLCTQVAFYFRLGVTLAVYVPPLSTIRALHIWSLFLISFDYVPVSADSHSFLEESACSFLPSDCKKDRLHCDNATCPSSFELQNSSKPPCCHRNDHSGILSMDFFLSFLQSIGASSNVPAQWNSMDFELLPSFILFKSNDPSIYHTCGLDNDILILPAGSHGAHLSHCSCDSALIIVFDFMESYAIWCSGFEKSPVDLRKIFLPNAP
jgi:hypothetical protein